MTYLDFEQAGTSLAVSFINTLSYAVNNSNLADQIVVKTTLAANETFQYLLNLSSTSNLGEQLGAKFSEFTKNFIQGTGWNMSRASAEIGTAVHQLIEKVLKEADIKNLTGLFTKELSDAFKEGISKLDMKGNMNYLSSEGSEGINIFRDFLFTHLDLFRSDAQTILAKIVRDMTLKILPWASLGSAIALGTPLLMLYGYKKMTYHIGRPKLAQEIRKTGLIDRAKDTAVRVGSSILQASGIGAQWGALAATIGTTLAVYDALSSVLMTGEFGYGGKVLNGLSCFTGNSEPTCKVTEALPLIFIAAAVGTLRTHFALGNTFCNFIKKSMKKEVKPIFNSELQMSINEITEEVSNIKRNGGFLPNVLLYGPAGTGKTMVSKYIAKNSKMNYILMTGGDLAQYIKRGEHITELNKLFEEANSNYLPTIVFIDECESLCKDRSKIERPEERELINGFLSQTGEDSQKIMIILATNRKEDLDIAIMDRMNYKLLVDLPKNEERKKIIELYLPTFFSPSERKELFDAEMINKIAEETEGLSGRTIFKMLNKISVKRATTPSNQLTKHMVDETVESCLKQQSN